MQIKKLYEVQTESNITTGEEIATLIVNLNRGLKLEEIKAVNDKIYFVLSEKDLENSNENVKYVSWHNWKTQDNA